MKPNFHCGMLLLTAAALGSAAFAPQALAQNAPPKYKADVPQSIKTPDTVQTERLGTLKFFDGMPDEATVQKVYDNLSISCAEWIPFSPAYRRVPSTRS